MSCECNCSYTCDECQNRIDLQNQIDYANERMEWIVQSILLIAQDLGVNLPPEPQKRGQSSEY